MTPFSFFWQIVVALVFGIIAKEQVVAILGTLLPASGQPLSEALPAFFTPVTAFGFMVLTLVYMSCVATLGVMKKEIGIRWTMFSVAYGLVLGWGPCHPYKSDILIPSIGCPSTL